jgi:hypothetical protein
MKQHNRSAFLREALTTNPNATYEECCQLWSGPQDMVPSKYLYDGVKNSLRKKSGTPAKAARGGRRKLATAIDANGAPVAEPVPAGVPLSNLESLEMSLDSLSKVYDVPEDVIGAIKQARRLVSSKLLLQHS